MQTRGLGRTGRDVSEIGFGAWQIGGDWGEVDEDAALATLHAAADAGVTFPGALRAWNDRSRENLGMETLDLVQVHCPPTDLYYQPEVFEDLDAMAAEGRMVAYGVSVERVEEALKAIEYPGVATVQIIFNPVRQRPPGCSSRRPRGAGSA